VTANDRCGIDCTMESSAVKGVHVLGDATLSAPAMPNSGSMANQHAKICAAAVIALINGQQPDASPKIANTCYSYVSDKEAIHVASVHTWNDKDKTLTTVPGSGGVSSARSELEGASASAWATNIWQDVLG
jgi:NADH dehydrogenase FAD-containing subunit